jgi:hypothetical protein
LPIKIIVKTGLQGPQGEATGSRLQFDWEPSDGIIKTITHNLNTKYFPVTIIDNNNGEIIEVDEIANLSSNVLQLTSTESPEGLGWTVIIN